MKVLHIFRLKKKIIRLEIEYICEVLNMKLKNSFTDPIIHFSFDYSNKDFIRVIKTILFFFIKTIV